MERIGFRIIVSLVILFGTVTQHVFAHEVRPAYLEIKQVSATEYQVLWKVPTNGGRLLQIDPIFPKGFETEIIRTDRIGASQVQQLKATYEGNLSGKTITITSRRHL